MNKIKLTYKVFINIILVLALMFIATCSEDAGHGPYGSDGIPPGKVTINEVVNTAGGAVIYFTPPSDEDLLYIKASFEDENELAGPDNQESKDSLNKKTGNPSDDPVIV